MKRTRWITLALVVVFLLGVVGIVYGVGTTEINWFVFGGGGGGAASSGGDVTMNSTVGQTAIGGATSTGGVGIGSGYWYGNTRQNKIYLPLIMR
jgi:cyanate permease